MKYIKSYEELNKEPQIGDYIIAHFEKFGNNKKDKAWEDYLNNSIGQIIKKEGEDAYRAKYFVTDEIYEYAFKNKERKFVKEKNGEKYIMMRITNNIIVSSSNKDDLKMLLTSKKYNL